MKCSCSALVHRDGGTNNVLQQKRLQDVLFDCEMICLKCVSILFSLLSATKQLDEPITVTPLKNCCLGKTGIR